MLRSPRDLSLRLDLGFRLLNAGRVLAATSVFRTVLTQDPRSFAALLGLSKAARAEGDIVSALAYATRAGFRDPGEHGVQLDRASYFSSLGRSADAEAVLRAILDAEPGHLGALMALGRLARESGARAEAVAWFLRAHDADPGFMPATVALAEEERAGGRPAEASRLLGEVLAAEPDHLEALLSLADQAWLAQDYDRCLSLCLQAARAHPDHPAPALQATRALIEQGRTAEALALLDPLGVAQGWPPPLRSRKAEILMSDGAWDEAAALLDAPGLPNEFLLWLHRVRLKLALGAFDAAASLLDASPARGPAELGWLGLLRGQLAEARWQHEAARSAYASVLTGNPNASWPHAELSRVTLLMCDLEACRAHIDTSLQLDAAVHTLRGQSLNPGSTHVGQIWDEFRMDRPRAARLRDLIGMPARDRIEPLLQMVREAPDHMPTAMQLGIALRQSGHLNIDVERDASDALPATPAIPRRIVQYWDESPPPEIAAMMAGWQQRHPDYAYVTFDLAGAGEYLREHHPIEVVHAYIRCRMPAQKADIFRLAYLAREGGIYVDADDRCLGHLSGAVDGRDTLAGATLVAWQEHFGTLGNNFLAASPGHPVLARAALLAVAAINRGDEDIAWLATGPGLLTRAFAQILAEAPDLGKALQQCRVLERFELARLALFHQFAPYKRTKRHWLRAAFGATDTETADDASARSAAMEP